MNIRSDMKALFAGAMALAGFAALAETTVTIESAEVGTPWTTVDVRYTLGGTDADLKYKVAVDIAAKGETRSVTNAAAALVDGTTAAQIDTTKLFNPVKPDPKAQVAVTVLAVKPETAVQLWKDGPYWATCNVGAKRPEEAGYYFWWGDTKGYVYVNDAWQSVDGTVKNYAFSNCPIDNMLTDQVKAAGYTDDEGKLVAAHDAATVKLGAKWRMPTADDCRALLDSNNCTSEATTDWRGTGVPGRIFTGVTEGYTDKSIFIPGVGLSSGSGLVDKGDIFYWTSTQCNGQTAAYWFVGMGVPLDFYRVGRPIRPIRVTAE